MLRPTLIPRFIPPGVLPDARLLRTAFGWPLVICGGLKIVYDLALLAMFRRVRPPEEPPLNSKEEEE